jgi:hypothetical protein
VASRDRSWADVRSWWPPVLAIGGTLALWLLLAFANRGTTYHFAPLIVAAAGPVTARLHAATALPWRHVVALAAGSLTAATLGTALVWPLGANGGTQVGRAVDGDGIPDAVAAFVRVAEGVAWREAGLPGDPAAAAMDIRAYYEEVALALADHVPAARAAESWLYRTTETGAVLKAAMTQMAQADPPYERILYLVPMSQQ